MLLKYVCVTDATLATKARLLGAAHTLHAAVKNLRNLYVKASLARDLRALLNFNITDRALRRGHHLCKGTFSHASSAPNLLRPLPPGS